MNPIKSLHIKNQIENVMFIRLKFISYLILVFLFLSCKNLKTTEFESVTVAPDTFAGKTPINPVFMYGIPTDSFDLVSGHIKRNGFLSEILLKHGVSMQEIDQTLKNSKSVFDVRKVRSGNNYILFCDKDSIARARFMI